MKRSAAAYGAELLMRGLLVGISLSVILGYVWGDGAVTLLTGCGISVGVVLLFALIRKLTNRFALFFIGHILISVVIIQLLSGLAPKIICGAALAVLIGDSVSQLRKTFDEGNRVHFGMLPVFLLASYGAGYNDMPVLEYACFALTAIFTALYFMRTGFYNTQEFIDNNDNGRGTPLKDIRLRSYSLVAAFAVCICAFMIATRYMGGETIAKGLCNAFFALISALVRWLIYHLQGEYIPDTETANEGNMLDFVKDAFQEQQVPAFVVILEKIIQYLFTAVIIIGAVALVLSLVFRLYSIFGKTRSSKTSTISEFISPVKIDKTVRHIGKKATEKPLSNKARRYYKKYVRKHLADKELSQSKTPLEISRQLGLDTTAQDAEIRRIYEKSRYSEESCTGEELRKMKSYVKGEGK